MSADWTLPKVPTASAAAMVAIIPDPLALRGFASARNEVIVLDQFPDKLPTHP